jgi:outer membrane protein assembly factor BamB
MANRSQPRFQRWLPPRLISIVLALIVAAILWLQIAHPLGDRGFDNVVTMALAGLAVAVALLWFTFFSGHAWWIRLAPLAALIVGALIFKSFFRLQYSGELAPSVALRSDEHATLDQVPAAVAAGVDLTTTTADDFPQFLGPRRDTSIDGVELARDWQSRPPELVWRRPIGEGWSAFAVVNGTAVTMEQRGDLELVTAYDVESGEPRWSHSTPTRYELLVAGTGPRATPTIDGGWVFAQGATGKLVALDGATGELRWQHDLLAEYGVTPEVEAEALPYGRSGSPLVAGGLVVVPAGGPPDGRKVSLVAYDRTTGERVWEGGDQQISCSSPTLATLGGVEQILIVNESTVSGHDVATGAVLWQHPWGEGRSNANANVSQAMPLPPNRVFLSKGYGIGAALLELHLDGGAFAVEEIWHASQVMRTKFTNPAILDGHVYGLSDGILESIELETGERMWKGGRYRQGQILRVGGLLLVVAESGEVSLVEATPERRNHVLGSFQAIDGKTWNNPALYGPYLLVRNSAEAACYKLPLA